MTAPARLYASYNRLEWWYAHLVTALSEHLEVVARPMSRPNQPGLPIESDISGLIDGDHAAHSIYLGSIDQLFPGIPQLRCRTAIWSDFLQGVNERQLPGLQLFDVVFCTQKSSVAALRRHGVRHVEWLPFAFDTTLANNPAAERRYDVGFVGSLDLPVTRAERREVLGRLERRYRLNDYRAPAFGDSMMRVYNASRIVVNIPVPGGFNMRTFEAMASGALLLTKAVGNGQEELFTDGTHLVTYRDTDDLEDKVAYYLHHDREREEIARSGATEVLTHHTYRHRARRFLDTMAAAAATRATDPQAHLAAYAAFYDHVGRADLLAAMALRRGMPARARVRMLSRAVAKVSRGAAKRLQGRAC